MKTANKKMTKIINATKNTTIKALSKSLNTLIFILKPPAKITKNIQNPKISNASKISASPACGLFLIGVFGLNGCFGYRALPVVQNPQENIAPKQCAKIQSLVIGLIDSEPCEDCAQKDGIKELETPKQDKKSKKSSTDKNATKNIEKNEDAESSPNEPQNALGITQAEAKQALLAGLNDLCEELQEYYVVSLRYASTMSENRTKGVFVATDTKQASVRVELEFVPDFFNGERKRFSARANSQMEIKGKKILEIGKNIDIEPKDKAYLLRRAMDSAIKAISKNIQKARTNGGNVGNSANSENVANSAKATKNPK